MSDIAEPAPYIEAGSAAWRRVVFSLFVAGCATFSLLYCVQPLLPEFARDFSLSPATSSLALSMTTGSLAFAIFAAGALSQMMPRRALMLGSLVLASLCNLACALPLPWWLLLTIRFAEGVALGGVPAVAMAYLAEEIAPRDLGRAMGQYVAGTAFGGMMGRVGMGLLTEVLSWRAAMAVLGGLCLLGALAFAALLPPSRHFTAKPGFNWRDHRAIWGRQIRNGALARLFLVGFTLTGVFVTLFNYAGFRLAGAPYHLRPTAVSLIFLAYISGIFASPLAGWLADRLGRRLPLVGMITLSLAGIVATLGQPLWAMLAGILMVTMGFFGAHAVASGWIGALAGREKSHGSALYLLSYYIGSSVMGWVGGWFWQHWGWPGVAGLTAAVALLGLSLAVGVRPRGMAQPA